MSISTKSLTFNELTDGSWDAMSPDLGHVGTIHKSDEYWVYYPSAWRVAGGLTASQMADIAWKMDELELQDIEAYRSRQTCDD